MKTYFAPAKVNLGLRVLGRRDDGYHLLESLFVPLDLGDEIEIEVEAQGARKSTGSLDFELSWTSGAHETAGGVPSGPENLAARAASAFLEAAGLSAHVKLRLRKQLPAGAGMGGGSSNAGTVLRALRDHFPGVLSSESLARLALALGADVPFFLDPRPAVVEGIGERIQPVGALPRLWLLVVNPGISLATAQVFRAYDQLAESLTPIEAGSTMRALSGLGASLEQWIEVLDSGLLVNDLEPAARRLCPPVARSQERIRALGARWVGMSGSGATVYGVFTDPEAAQRALREALQEAIFEPPHWVRLASVAGPPEMD